MHRFFISPDCIAHNTLVIKDKLVHQISDVLRLGAGDSIVVVDDSGWEYEVELRKVGRDHVEGVITSKSPALGEPHTRVSLYQALLKGSKFEFALQKGTELGVIAFIPLLCERCVVGEVISEPKLTRWRRVITEAAEQSGRGKVPILYPAVPFREACESVSGFSLLPWEKERMASLRTAVESQLSCSEGSAPLSVNIFVGPEGGFSSSEVEFAQSCGILPVSLGRRILRAETAGLVATSAILYHCGELGDAYS